MINLHSLAIFFVLLVIFALFVRWCIKTEIEDREKENKQRISELSAKIDSFNRHNVNNLNNMTKGILELINDKVSICKNEKNDK